MTGHRRYARALAVLGISMGTMLATAGPASAERVVRDDPRRDIVSFEEVRRDRPPARTDHVDPRPGRRMGDITRTVIRHTRNKIVLRTKYARLNRKQGNPFSARWLIQDHAGAPTSVRVEAAPGAWAGTLFVSSPLLPVPARVLAEPCGTHAIKYRKNVVKVVLPRECLDFPLWIRVVSFTRFVKDDRLVFLDDGLQKGVPTEPTESPFAVSEPISPG